MSGADLGSSHPTPRIPLSVRWSVLNVFTPSDKHYLLMCECLKWHGGGHGGRHGCGHGGRHEGFQMKGFEAIAVQSVWDIWTSSDAIYLDQPSFCSFCSIHSFLVTQDALELMLLSESVSIGSLNQLYWCDPGEQRYSYWRLYWCDSRLV